MDCQGFKHWLLTRDECDPQTTRRARKHRQDCPACNCIYAADEGLERFVSSCIDAQPSPSGLADRARSRAGAEPEPAAASRSFRLWRGLAPALALGLMLVFVVWNPWANPLTSLDVIGDYALANHTRADMDMAFKADETPDPQAWFRERLNFRITMPSLSHRGYTFLGGRECTIGPKKAAYLYYDHQGKHVSVFMLPAADVKLSLQDDRNYRTDAPRYRLDLWKSDDMVCILVQDRNSVPPSTT